MLIEVQLFAVTKRIETLCVPQGRQQLFVESRKEQDRGYPANIRTTLSEIGLMRSQSQIIVIEGAYL